MAYINGNKPIVTNGLVYALDFGNSKSYVSGSNRARSLVFDPATTIVTGSTAIPTLSTAGLTFAGSQFIQRSASLSALDPNGTFTICAVVKANTAGTLFTQNSSAGNLSGRFQSTSSLSTGFTLSSGDFSRIYTGNFTGSQHVTYRYNSGSFDTFINGIPVTASQANTVLTGSDLTSTLFINSGSLPFSGSLSSFYVYNRALTADEIYQNFEIASTRYGLPYRPKPYTIDENLYQFLQTTGITDTVTTNALSTFISGLKSNGLWNKMVAIYPFVSNTTASLTTNLKEPGIYRLGLTGSFSASAVGLTPSSSTSFINTPGLTTGILYTGMNTGSSHITLLSYDLPQTSSYPAAILGGVGATGGNVTFANGKVIHTFTSGSGSFIPTHPSLTSVEVLVVAGGGGGGRGDGNNYGAGGGGAGGYTYSSSFSVTPSTTYATVVGQGGLGAVASRTSGSNGENSQFSTIVSIGGGGGGEGGNNNPGGGVGSNGGSGGGGGGRVTAPQANSGSGVVGQGNGGGLGGQSGAGAAGGGGGGAGGVGSSASGFSLGVGGAGISSSIEGTLKTYAAGGNGGDGVTDIPGNNGQANTGTGGQGTRFSTAGNGGSGVVVVSYPAISGQGPTNGFFITDSTVSGSLNSEFTGGITGSGNIGLLTISRTGSNSLLLRKNNDQAIINSSTTGSFSVGLFLGGANLAGGTSSFGNSNTSISYVSIGSGLTTTEVATYHNLIGQLQANLKRQNTLLDNYSGAELAHSLRRVGPSSYLGPAIKVQRSSDNALRDIGFTSDGKLDTVGLLDFVGVTGSGFVNTWYDQSGNGRDFAASGTPLVVISGSIVTVRNKPSVYLNGSSGFSTFGAPYLANTPITIFNYQQLWLNDNAQRYYFVTTMGTNGGLYIGFAPNDNWLLAVWGYQDNGIIPNTQTLNPNLLTGIYTSPGSLFYKDGQLVGTNTTTPPVGMFTNSQSQPSLRLGGWWGGFDYPGIISENIIYARNLTSTRADIDSNILSYYATGSDTDYQAFITATGITQPTQSAALETLVSDLKSYGLWNKMKAIYPMITDKNNRFAYSQALGTTWNATNVYVTQSFITAPDGTLTGNFVSESAVTDSHYIYQTISDGLVTGSEYVASIHGKFLNRPWIAIETNTGAKAWFNIQTGITGSLTGSNATITSVGSGWYRCALYFTSSVASGPQNIQYNLADANGNLSYAGVAGTGSYLWGAQFENGNVLGPYRATTTVGFTTGSMLDQMKFNLKNTGSFSGSYFGNWNGGYSGNKPDGVSAYMDTNYNPSVSGQLNSAHLSHYSRTNLGIGTIFQLIGVKEGSNIQGLAPSILGGDSYNSINSTDTAIGTLYSRVDSFIMSNRNSPSEYNNWYKNIKVSTTTKPSTAIPNGNIFLSGRNNNGSLLFPDQNEKSFVTIGDGLTDYEAKALYWIVQKYQTTLGRQVY